MESFKTVYKEQTEITPEIIFPKISKYAYHILIPQTVAQVNKPLRILIWGHGSINTDNYEDIIAESRQEMAMIEEHSTKHGLITIMPILPRYNGDDETPPLDAQMFGSPTMIHNWNDFYFRPDAEVRKVAHHLIKLVKEKGHKVDDKLLVGGISAGANMANRFAFLYPSLTRAVAIPLAGNYAYPISQIDDMTLPYPFGTANISDIQDNFHNSETYSKLPFFVYDGEQDTNPRNDPLEFETSATRNVSANKFRQVFGSTQYQRFLHFSEYMKKLGTPITIESSAIQGHSISDSTISNVFEFFDNNS